MDCLLSMRHRLACKIVILFLLRSIMLFLHLLSTALCLVWKLLPINIGLDSLMLMLRYLRKYYGEIITLIMKLKNFQKNLCLALRKEPLSNLFYSQFIKYSRIQWAKIK